MSFRGASILACALAACFSPSPPTGVPCESDVDCPGSQICHPVSRTCELDCTGCTAPDAPPDSPPAADCWDAWLSGSIKFDVPVRLDTLLIGDSNSQNPTVSGDGLVLYFDSGQNFFRATRNTVADAFDSPLPVSELATVENESRISTTGDDQVAVFASARTGTLGLLDIWQAQRGPSQAFGTPSSALFAVVNDPNNQFDPEITPDGLDLYWAPAIEGTQRIHHASRSSIDAPFTSPSTLDIIANDVTNIFDPTISPDQRVLVFAGQTTLGSGDLFFTTRSSLDKPFAPAVTVPDVNSSGHDGDSELSADGCTLYFASNRENRTAVYAATVMK